MLNSPGSAIADAARSCAREPLAQLPRGFVRRASVQRASWRWARRKARSVRAPAILGDGRHFDKGTTSPNGFFKAMDDGGPQFRTELKSMGARRIVRVAAYGSRKPATKTRPQSVVATNRLQAGDTIFFSLSIRQQRYSRFIHNALHTTDFPPAAQCRQMTLARTSLGTSCTLERWRARWRALAKVALPPVFAAAVIVSLQCFWLTDLARGLRRAARWRTDRLLDADSGGTDPVLHLVDLAASRVDWARTNRYAASAAQPAISRRRQATIPQSLSSQTRRRPQRCRKPAPDRATRLGSSRKLARIAGRIMQNHHNSRQAEVRQMLSVARTGDCRFRAARGAQRFALNLFAFAESPVSRQEPLLPPPTPKEAIERSAGGGARRSTTPAEANGPSVSPRCRRPGPRLFDAPYRVDHVDTG